MNDGYVEIDLKEVKDFVNSTKFHEYLLTELEFNEAVFVLQVLLDEIDKHS